MNKFKSYCKENKVDVSSQIDVETLKGFVAYLAAPSSAKVQGLRYTTVQSYVAAIKSWALDQGLCVPNAEQMAPIKTFVRGLKRLQHGREGSARLPVTIELCGLIKTVLDRKRHSHRVFWAMLATGVRGLFRLGELTVDNTTSEGNKERMVRQADLTRFKERACSGYALKLRVSKTDPFRESTTVHLFRTGDAVCAASALDDLLNRSPFTRNGNTPLFALANGQPLLRPRFITWLQQCIRRVNEKFGLNFDWSKFSGHSLRRGGATSLAANDVSEQLIQVMGRWKSNTHRVYIANSRADLFAATSTINVPKGRNSSELVEACLKGLNEPYEPEVGGL